MTNVARKLIKKLEDNGWVRLGTGINATALGKDGVDYVIKVGFNTTDGWLDYAINVMKRGLHTTNPHFPRIERLAVFKDFFVAKMERLHTTYSELEFRREMTPDIEAQRNHIIRGVYNNKALPWNVGQIPNTPRKATAAEREAAAFLRKNFDAFDLHGGNLMTRKTDSGDQVVIIDPVYIISDRCEAKRFRRSIRGRRYLATV